MLRYLGGRLVHVLLVLAIVSLALTYLIDLTPGDPAYALLGDQATPQQIREVHRELHLDDPFYARYGRWLGDVAHGDLGVSYYSRENVRSAIGQALPITAEIILVSLLLSLLISIPLGVYTAYRAGGVLDRAWLVVSSALLSIPIFVQALLLVFVFALKVRLFPATGWVELGDGLGEHLRYIALPVLALALIEIPAFSRLLRADMLSTLQEDFILNARAKGQSPRRILFGHALRPSSMSTVTLAGLSIARMMGGALLIEVLFALPGVGQLLYNAVNFKDIPMVQGIVMFIAVIYLLANTLVDLAYQFLDPRIRAAADLR